MSPTERDLRDLWESEPTSVRDIEDIYMMTRFAETQGQEEPIMTSHPGIVHTYPANDVIEHETEGDECACGPTVTPIKADTGEMNWHILHHSLDGRENHEGGGNERP